MLLKIDPLGYDVPSPAMSYSDFFIRSEHKFLRNICLGKEIKHSPQICTLQSYYETYQKFIKVFCLLKHKYLLKHKTFVDFWLEYESR